MKIIILQTLERVFGTIASWATAMQERCAVCPDCGRNRYTGMACIVMREEHPCQ